MSSSRRCCVNSPNVFCYVCREYTLPENRKNITDFVERAYMAYFGVKLGDQDKYWAPQICPSANNVQNICGSGLKGQVKV